MITYDDVLAAYPHVEEIDVDRVNFFVDIANNGFPASRFGNKPAVTERGRILYVMHMLEQPAVDTTAPHVRAQMGLPKPDVKKPSPWASTEHGRSLALLVG